MQTRLDAGELAAVDEAVASGRFASRSEALRAGLALLLRERREEQIQAAYRRGYAAAPQEPWLGELGLALLGAAASAEPGDEDI